MLKNTWNKMRIFAKKASGVGGMDNEDGVTAIEYGLIAGLVSVTIVAFMGVLSSALTAAFAKIAASLPI